MLRHEKVKGREGQFRSLAGMSVEEFDWLHNYYAVEWQEYSSRYTVSGVVRTRPHRKRKDGRPEETQDQLLFVLHYLKSNALQAHHAAACRMTRPQVASPALETAAQNAERTGAFAAAQGFQNRRTGTAI